jgi:uncharacterized protein YyaL (SSP411 family)
MNRLTAETSPYLLQHKDNPVNWYAWCDEAWETARRENKPVLVSIGYSACHWCHVMEHEVFEDFECAELMNMHFICIKVDREERPDVDSWFMDAAHLMGSQGGWPLNVFTLPDGRPVYGGTYFPKSKWIALLMNLRNVFQTDHQRVEEYAQQLDSAMRELNFPDASKAAGLSISTIHDLIENWSKYWDTEWGGNRKAPKFPMPNNWELLLNYAVYFKDEKALRHVNYTLRKMAHGGLYDQLAGGFARYSVDAEWKVPHFEKMLYDNAQLVSLYAQAYRATGDDLLLRITDETLSFMMSEWKTPEGLYCAALDADSEGVEGKYYVWSEADFNSLLGADSSLLKAYFGVGSHGYWEHDASVLCIKNNPEEWCRLQGIDAHEWNSMLASAKKKLFDYRSNRIKPGLDDKCITSWNALLVKAFAEASKMRNREYYLENAENLIGALCDHLRLPSGLFAHTRTKGVTSNLVLLEDQVTAVDALLVMYEVNGNENHLGLAREIMLLSLAVFSNEGTFLLSNRAKAESDIIGVKFETSDNVIPCANSIAANCLLKLGRYLDDRELLDRASSMIQEVSGVIDFAPGFSNWLLASLLQLIEPTEVVFTGPKAMENARIFHQRIYPFVISAASTMKSELPLLKGKNCEETLIYVCRNHSCNAPLHSLEDLIIK